MERKSQITRFSTAAAPSRARYSKLAAARPPRAIHTEREYCEWRRVLDTLMAKPEEEMTDAEAAYGETIAILIEAFERQRYSDLRASPAEVLAELLSAHGLKQKELVDIFGSEAAVSYALNGKRNLTTEQIQGLSAKFHVSPAVFLAQL
jgi:HTH-type transcriptional regulator / antitoxin HigA